jgi:hypothetical protein
MKFQHISLYVSFDICVCERLFFLLIREVAFTHFFEINLGNWRFRLLLFVLHSLTVIHPMSLLTFFCPQIQIIFSGWYYTPQIVKHLSLSKARESNHGCLNLILWVLSIYCFLCQKICRIAWLMVKLKVFRTEFKYKSIKVDSWHPSHEVCTCLTPPAFSNPWTSHWKVTEWHCVCPSAGHS